MDPRDRRGGRRRAGQGRHADERPPGQRELPDRHAAQLAAEVPRREPGAVRSGAGRRTEIMSKGYGPLADRPENPAVGLEVSHESADLHVTGTALYTNDFTGRTPGTLHAWPVQAPH